MKSQFFASCSLAALLIAAPAVAQEGEGSTTTNTSAGAGQTAANGDATTDTEAPKE